MVDLKTETERRALAEAGLSEVLRRTVVEQEAERQRIARELHDSLGQSLTLLQLGLNRLGRSDPAKAGEVGALNQIADEAGAGDQPPGLGDPADGA